MIFNFKDIERMKKFLLAGDKFRPQMHLRQPKLSQSSYGSFTRNKERIQKIKKQESQDIFISTN